MERSEIKWCMDHQANEWKQDKKSYFQLSQSSNLLEVGHNRHSGVQNSGGEGSKRTQVRRASTSHIKCSLGGQRHTVWNEGKKMLWFYGCLSLLLGPFRAIFWEISWKWSKLSSDCETRWTFERRQQSRTFPVKVRRSIFAIPFVFMHRFRFAALKTLIA